MDLDRLELEKIYSQGYGFYWKGKSQAIKEVENNEIEYIPYYEGNLYIEGDNLIALKRLQKEYQGKIKCIYIDPPYNTNKKFLYNDKFSKTKKDSLSNWDRLHTNWLNMMYPRLILARELLSDDGVIFISIDDNEQANLKLMCDEIFGEENFIANIIWQSKSGGGHDEKFIVKENEYILVIAKNKGNLVLGRRIDLANDKYRLKDNYERVRGKYLLNKLDRRMTSSHYTESLNYKVIMPDGSELWPGGNNYRSNEGWNWRWSSNKLEWGIKNEFIEMKKVDGKWSIYTKQYEFVDNNGEKVERTLPYRNMIFSSEFSTTQASNEIIKLFNYKIFEYAKTSKLLEYFCKIGKLEKKDIILDFFSGSATTAHAVMQLNAEDGGNRKYIMVQLPELCDEKSEAYKAGYKNICEIGKERIRRAGEMIKSDESLPLENREKLDTGFKVVKL